MSHKVDQRLFRINGINDWKSRGPYQRNFSKYLEEDFKIRQFIKKQLPQGTVESVEIERESTQLKVIINTPRPGLVIGRKGEGVKELQAGIAKIVRQGAQASDSQGLKQDLKVEIQEIRESWGSASLGAQWVAMQIEKRVAFRRALKMGLQKIMSSKKIKGARIQVAGKLNGLEFSRREWLEEGDLPRHNLRADLDYGFAEAYCPYGVIGVKVWIYKGEKFTD